MQNYINQAKLFVNPNSTKILENNKIYHRNRIIDKATTLYVSDVGNLKSLYNWVKEDIVTDEYRAQHHGVKIGTIIGWTTSPKDDQYYAKVAKIKAKFRTMMLTQIV